MRFLKDIIAKKAIARQAECQAEMEMDDEDFPEWEEDDGDEVIADEPVDIAVPQRPVAMAPASERPNRVEAPQPDLVQDDLEEPDQDDMEEPGQDDMALKIWEMFNEDEEKPEPEAPAIEEPDDSQHDLAREALKSMIGKPPVVEKSPQRDPVAANTPKALADAEPAPRAGRVKTRMLGFHSPEAAVPKVFDSAKTKELGVDDRFPVGWLVVIEGPGRGTFFALHCGVSTVGRGTDQQVRLDFGDSSISRDSHAVIAYDEDSNAFYVGHTGKANLVRLNGRPVLSTEEVSNFDLIRIGETALRFVGFCGPEFAWDMTDDEEILHARAG